MAGTIDAKASPVRRSALFGEEPADKGMKAVRLSLGVSVAAVAAVLLVWTMMVQAQKRFTPGPEQAEVIEPLFTGPPGPTLATASYVHGRSLFLATCTACHGPEGKGVKGLGKDLTRSGFVSKVSDKYLTDFVKVGRDVNDPLNTTKVQMPPKGGNPALTEADLNDLVTFIRGLQDPRRLSEETQAEVAKAVAAANAPTPKKSEGADDDAEWLAFGHEKFVASCASCHGTDAKGMKGLGKDLTTSEFAKKLSDEELIAFVKRGRDPSDPLNTTKVQMPPKGGNPALNDDQLEAIVGYLRTLQEKSGASK